jgi:hypothetical protein
VQQTVLEVEDAIPHADGNGHYPVIATLLLDDAKVDGRDRVDNEPDEPEDREEVKPNAVIAAQGTEKIISKISHYMLLLEKKGDVVC